jgi:hypothetical protein
VDAKTSDSWHDHGRRQVERDRIGRIHPGE